jgi:hypothetical protein
VSLIHAEDFDSLTPPAMPLDWNVGTGFTSTTVIDSVTPTTSPNEVKWVDSTNGTYYATWGTATDGNGGNCVVQCDVNTFGATSTDLRLGVTARGSASTLTSSTSNYAAWLDYDSLLVGISKQISGTETTLASHSVSLASPGWYTLIFTLSGTSLQLEVQRQSDGYWLNSSGTFVSGQTTALTVTDSTLGSAGYAGVFAEQFGAGMTGFFDTWSFSTVGIAPSQPIPFTWPSNVRANSIVAVLATRGFGSQLRPLSTGVIQPPPSIPSANFSTVTGCCCGTICKCLTTICVQGCGGGTIPGAVVTVYSGSTFVATCTTSNITGCCTLCIGTAGTYTVTVTAQGYTSYSGSQSLACGGSITITLSPTGIEPPCYTFQIAGCCGNSSWGSNGPVLTVNGGIVTVSPNGNATWCSPGPGSYSWSVTACNMMSASGTIDVTTCSYVGNNIIVQLQPLSGYVCGFNGPYATPPTLNLTDAIYGATSLTYDGTTNTYTGSISGCTIANPPCTATPIVPGSPLLVYSGCPPCTGFTIYYTLSSIGPPGCNAVLNGVVNATFCGWCPPSPPPGGIWSWDGLTMPSDTFYPNSCSGSSVAYCAFGSVGAYSGTTQTGYNCSFQQIDPYPTYNYYCPMDVTFQALCPFYGLPCDGSQWVNVANPCGVWSYGQASPGIITITE